MRPLSLALALESAKTEEDLKDAYIKALGLKNTSKGRVDIQTPEIWFEAKVSPTPPLLMFAQLLVYICKARRRGEPIPGFLGVIDREKAALMATEHALPLLEDNAINWPKSGSAADKALAAQITPMIEGHFVLYPMKGYEAEFVKATKDVIRQGRIIDTQINRNNLRQVFDKWVKMVGVELGVRRDADYAALFIADIMHDGHNEAMRRLPARLLFSGEKPVFIIGNEQYELASDRGYRNFWSIYNRPPEEKDRQYLLERRDSLLPLDEQKFKGAFYTPLHIVDKAYDQLAATLGLDWQHKYIVWDMCAGVGNLETAHSNLRNVFMSTLDQEDVTIMRGNPRFAGAEIFQYDYLNDDVTDFGEIDYTITNKVPMALRQAIVDAKAGTEGAKPILVLINPPYAEATNNENVSSKKGAKNKVGVAKNRYSAYAMGKYGKASKELFTQFLARIQNEMARAEVAIFSKLKYFNAPNFSVFRQAWRASFLDGFIVHSKAFEGLKGQFPIGFLIWRVGPKIEVMNSIAQIDVAALDRSGQQIASKSFFNVPNEKLLNVWFLRPRANRREAVPLKNALVPTPGLVRVSTWSDDAVGYMYCGVNDVQHASQQTVLFSSPYGGGNGFYINSKTLSHAAIVFSVRRLIKPTWLNDRDQFLQPSEPLTDAFKSDCLIWMLFNGSNLTAGADGLRWNDRDWSLVNHFIPFTEAEVGAKARFESEFMVRYMAGMAFSPEAQAVLDEGRKLWTRFHAIDFPHKIRDELKLNRADAGWYQIRKALEQYGDTELTDFDPFKSAYAALGNKLRPMVFELGFLPS